MTIRNLNRLVLAGLFLGLTACSRADLAAVTPFVDPPPPCPKINVLADAATLTKFKPGPGETLIDALFEAKIVDIGMACEHDIDGDTREGTLNVDLQLLMEASRGPADKSREAQIRYFVTLTDNDHKILGKEVFDMKGVFPGNLTVTRITDEPMELEIPLSAGKTGRDYQIYVGFQLTRQQLEYNRRRRQLTGR